LSSTNDESPGEVNRAGLPSVGKCQIN